MICGWGLGDRGDGDGATSAGLSRIGAHIAIVDGARFASAHTISFVFSNRDGVGRGAAFCRREKRRRGAITNFDLARGGKGDDMVALNRFESFDARNTATTISVDGKRHSEGVCASGELCAAVRIGGSNNMASIRRTCVIIGFS